MRRTLKTSSDLIIKQTTDVCLHLHNLCMTESPRKRTYLSWNRIKGHLTKTNQQCVIMWHVTNIHIRQVFQSTFKGKPYVTLNKTTFTCSWGVETLAFLPEWWRRSGNIQSSSPWTRSKQDERWRSGSQFPFRLYIHTRVLLQPG